MPSNPGVCAGIGLACGDITMTMATTTTTTVPVPFVIHCDEDLSSRFRNSNRIVWAQSAFGVLGVLSCLSAVLVIFAYRKDTVYLRERVLAGACTLRRRISIRTQKWFRRLWQQGGICFVPARNHRRAHKPQTPSQPPAGLFIANIIYSAADIVPMNVIETAGPDCGDYIVGNPGHGASSVAGECTPQTLFMFGLYCTTGFEIFMLATSISALLKVP